MKTIICLGGFHVSLNFRSMIGKYIQQWYRWHRRWDRTVYGSTTLQNILKGTYWKRGVWCHQIVWQALCHLLWEAFFTWLKDEEDGSDLDSTILSVKLAFEAADVTLTHDQILSLQGSVETLSSQMTSFTDMCKAQSSTFGFYLQYIEILEISLISKLNSHQTGIFISRLPKVCYHSSLLLTDKTTLDEWHGCSWKYITGSCRCFW